MKICIAGGGRVGRYLAQSLLANHHSVVIIEPVEAQCRMLADQLDIPSAAIPSIWIPCAAPTRPAATPLWP